MIGCQNPIQGKYIYKLVRYCSFIPLSMIVIQYEARSTAEQAAGVTINIWWLAKRATDMGGNCNCDGRNLFWVLILFWWCWWWGLASLLLPAVPSQAARIASGCRPNDNIKIFFFTFSKFFFFFYPCGPSRTLPPGGISFPHSVQTFVSPFLMEK